jgi:hypothetical protein
LVVIVLTLDADTLEGYGYTIEDKAGFVRIAPAFHAEGVWG